MLPHKTIKFSTWIKEIITDRSNQQNGLFPCQMTQTDCDFDPTCKWVKNTFMCWFRTQQKHVPKVSISLSLPTISRWFRIFILINWNVRATNLKKLTIYYFSFGLYRAPRLVRRLQPQHLREREDRRQLHRGDCARRHEAARRAPGWVRDISDI